jgi:hypothetical protein
MFLGLMIVLAAVGISASRSRPEPITGLPDDAGLLAARVVVYDRVLPSLGTLRLRSSLLGAGGVPRVFAPVVAENALRQTLVAGAQHRHARDPRVSALVAGAGLGDTGRRCLPGGARCNGSYGEASRPRRSWRDAVAGSRPACRARSSWLHSPGAWPCLTRSPPIGPHNRAVLLRRVGRDDESCARRAGYLAERLRRAERMRGDGVDRLELERGVPAAAAGKPLLRRQALLTIAAIRSPACRA